jgi:hypothetical protein
VARRDRFLAAEFSKRWDRTYQGLTPSQQRAIDDVVIALMKQKPTSGMRVKPVQPEKYYHEARINSGDRVVFRTAQDTMWFVDIVEHDHIGRYGKEIKGLFG